jgi:hypothetical protein
MGKMTVLTFNFGINLQEFSKGILDKYFLERNAGYH